MTTPTPPDYKAIGAAAKAAAKALAVELAPLAEQRSATAARTVALKAELAAAETAERAAYWAHVAVADRHSYARDIARACTHPKGLAALAYVLGLRADDDAFAAAKRRDWAYDGPTHYGYTRGPRTSAQGAAIADAFRGIAAKITPTETA